MAAPGSHLIGMMDPVGKPEFSWRADKSVPAFDDAGTIAVMDGSCVLCMSWARLIDRLDHSGRIRICPSQTPLGAALLAHFGMDPQDPESWLVLDRGQAHGALDGIVVLGQTVGGIGRVLTWLGALPKPVRDWIYRRIARNRFSLMGRRASCALPTPGLQARLVEPFA